MGKAFIAFIVSVAILGCSGVRSPIIPEADNQSNPKPAHNLLDSLPIVEGTVYQNGTFQGIGLMGAYELFIDPVALTADLVPKRTPSIGESWTVSGIGFFTIVPCSDCLKIDSISLTTENYLQIEFYIKHPFPAGNVSEPPTAFNRLDLNVFDAALLIRPIYSIPKSYLLTGVKAHVNLLAETAGYTKELANVIRDNTALPFMLVVDDNAADAKTWNEFSMGSESSFDVFFDLNKMTSFTFDLYLTMGYGKSATDFSQRLNPVYFNPEFNRKSAWKVKAIPPNGNDPPDRTNTWNNMDSSTEWNVTIEVFDWQHGVPTISDPPVDPEDIAFKSDVISVSVEIPGMTNELAIAYSPDRGSGAPDNPLTYTIPIANENKLPIGVYTGLVQVIDERIPQSTPPDGTIDFLIDSPDGVTLNNFAIPAFITYQTFTANVVSGNIKPTSSAIATTPTNILDGQSVTFDASASSDPDGTIVSYEWDFNGDGVFHGTGDDYSGSAWNPTHVFPLGDGIAEVQLKVTDNLGAYDILDTSITIIITPSKNLTLRSGIDILDIATIENTNDVLVLFENRQIWKYDSKLNNGSHIATYIWNGATDGRIEASNDGYFIAVDFPFASYGWIAQSFEPNGALITSYCGWGTVPDFRCEAFTSNNPTYSQALGFTSPYPPQTNWTFHCYYRAPSYDSLYTSIASFTRSGVGAVDATLIKGAHCCYSTTESYYLFLVEGHPEYKVERGKITGSYQPTLAWGSQSDLDYGFNNPQDLTIDNQNKVYILDILSTNQRRIKVYTLTGTSIGSFGNNTNIGNVPKHIEASWGNNWIYVSMNDTISIFFPPEHP